MGRLNRIFDTAPEIAPPAEPVTPSGVKGEVIFRNVSFRYPGTDRLVLQDISFTARAGETVAVVGSTGSGKTTLVSMIPRIFDPTEGEVLLDGIPLRHFDPRALRECMGFVPQDSFLFSDTIRSNIGLGRKGGEEETEDRIQRASEIAQIHDTILDFPRGYETRLGERGINLSGGQKQRATLARALARDPSVLVLDDALSAVDTQTETRILHDLRTDLAHRTAFLISHRVSAVMDADQILVLDEGRIVERGTHDSLIARNGVYAQLLRRQLLEEELEVESAAS